MPLTSPTEGALAHVRVVSKMARSFSCIRLLVGKESIVVHRIANNRISRASDKVAILSVYDGLSGQCHEALHNRGCSWALNPPLQRRLLAM